VITNESIAEITFRHLVISWPTPGGLTGNFEKKWDFFQLYCGLFLSWRHITSGNADSFRTQCFGTKIASDDGKHQKVVSRFFRKDWS
jgi:hypothetical protein